MKKLSKRFHKWLVRRSQQRRKPFRARNRPRFSILVTAWIDDRSEVVVSRRPPTVPPAVLCFDKNADATVSYLDRWRRMLAVRTGENPRNRQWITRPKRGRAWIPGYSDYSKITEISTAVSVVIAAEYDRARQLRAQVPPAINLDQWNQQAFQKLYEMGFFEIVGLAQDVRELFRQTGDIKTMQILSGKDASDLGTASEAILDLSKFIDQGDTLPRELFVALNTALSEAMSNVTKWAYPEGDQVSFQHVKSWWITATADRSNRTLTVVMFDQGASIPVTFPRQSRGKMFMDALARLFVDAPAFAFRDDGAYIEEAMKPGSTSTDQPWHGKGLPQMVDLIEACEGGSLTILSRGGECRYEQGKGMTRTSRQHSVGGTLIEWKLSLPVGVAYG